MSHFEELLAQLNAEQEEQSTLAKSLPAADAEDDEAIRAAAEDALADDELDEEDELEDEELDDELGEAPLTKSLTLDGEEVQVVDAEALVKSMQDLTTKVSKHEENLTKALETTLATVKQQSELIKSLTARVNKLASKGTGRKAVLSVHERPAVAAAHQADEQGFTAGDLLAKSHAAFDAGKINGLELTTIDVSLRENKNIDHGLLAKVLS